MDSRLRGNDDGVRPRHFLPNTVIPAKAGIHRAA